MQRVLSRDVWVESVCYPEGTPLEDVPADHDSLIFTGWTRYVEQPRETLTEALAAEVDEPAEEPETEPVEQAAKVEARPEPVEPVEADLRPLAELDLDSGLVERLADAGIKTIQDAIDYRTQNNGFRTLKGVGKSSEELICAALDSI